VKSREDVAGVVLGVGIDDETRRECERPLLQPLDAEQFGAERLLHGPRPLVLAWKQVSHHADTNVTIARCKDDRNGPRRVSSLGKVGRDGINLICAARDNSLAIPSATVGPQGRALKLRLIIVTRFPGICVARFRALAISHIAQ
jgi:hypothetical protein